jgi:hypothetical protein
MPAITATVVAPTNASTRLLVEVIVTHGRRMVRHAATVNGGLPLFAVAARQPRGGWHTACTPSGVDR